MLIVVGGEVDGPGHFWLPLSGQEPIYDLDSEFFTFIIGHDEENTKICRISFFQWEKTSNEERYENIRQYFAEVHNLKYPPYAERKRHQRPSYHSSVPLGRKTHTTPRYSIWNDFSEEQDRALKHKNWRNPREAQENKKSFHKSIKWYRLAFMRCLSFF